MPEVAPADTGAFGVYVHVPFCAARCDYCAFATWTDRGHLMSGYAAACVTELATAGDCGRLRPASSVFFGGGTPSLLPAEQLCSILASVPRLPGAEVTVEVNPDTATAELFAAYVAAGVTRVSLGVQSLDPAVLAGLGRSHDPAAVEQAAALAVDTGFDSWNIDLIYGAVGETPASWRRTLEAALALGPPHVAAYALTVEPGTPLATDAARHPDDDRQAEQYALADDVLAAAGLSWYEVSNWARPGHQCAHNRLYWSQGEYLGIGCAAHSHQSGRRWWNVRTPERYIALIEAGQPAEANSEQLDPAGRHIEALTLALRTVDGVAAAALPSVEEDPALDGLVEPAARPGRVRLTRRGRLLANEVALRLRPAAQPEAVPTGS